MAPATLRIRLLGELDLRHGETPVPPLGSARAESLLAYLLLHRDAPQPRQRLAFLLWPDSSEPQARTNLRHLLHNLRRDLPDPDRYLEVTPRTLRWRDDAPWWLDVAGFEEALDRAERPGQELPALAEAVELYGGDLLQSSYDEWLLEEREQLRRRYLDALERLAGLLEGGGEHARAIGYAERLLREDPLREATYRLLMRLHDTRGDRARALRAYHLLGQGQPVRVLEHRRRLDRLGERGAEVVTGDLTDAGDLGVLLKDVEAALVTLPDVVTDPEFTATRSTMSRTIVDALGGSGVRRVVALSTVAAGRDDAVGPAAGLRELELRLAGLADTGVLVLRSPFYMENLLAGLPLIQTQGINGSALDGELELPMIATRDVAGEAAAGLLRRDLGGHQVRLLAGPEDVSMRAATQALGERLGRPDLPYVQFPPDGLRAALLGAGMSESGASAMVELQLDLNRQRSFAAVRAAADATTPTRLEAFLSEVLR